MGYAYTNEYLPEEGRTLCPTSDRLSQPDCLLHFLLFPSLPDEEKTFVLARWQQVIGSCFAHVSLKRLRWERDKKRFPDYDIRPGVSL